MSSRIITGEDAQHVTAIVWRRVDPPTGPQSTPNTEGTQNAGGPDAGDLESRLRQLELEVANRELQARESGRQEGEAAARQALEAPMREALARLAGHIEALNQVRSRLRREAEEDLVRLAVEIARRVLRRELTADPAAILGLVKAALERVDAREVIRVRAHPEDARTIEACFADIGMPERIEVVADQNLERGAVILETTRGQLDASVETQLQEIERGFADLIHRG